MRKAFASLTATAVAGARALATGNARALTDPHDTVARRLVPRPLGRALDAVDQSPLGQHVLSPLLLRASLGMVDHIGLRCAAIDAALCASLAAGATQVVIVGAGLDGRAHRLEALHTADVYEVDHPASQREKRARAVELPIMARSLHYVPVDLARGELDASLRDAGFDASARCFVVVEGVLPYLTRPQTDALLRQLAALCASGSQLVLSYVPEGATWLRWSRWLVGPSLRAIGEPLGELPTPAELSTRLRAHGFEVERDAAPAELVACRGQPPITFERILLAQRR
jgi:methyltransferase (TIGR00027 family)